jgi:hypothetical protein
LALELWLSVRTIDSFGARFKTGGVNMSSKLLHRNHSRLIGILAIIALALSSAATVSADTTTKKITFDHEVVIGGTKLPSGDYTLVIQNGHVTVKAENKVVAQCTAHWEARDNKPDSSSVLYGDNNQVIEIRFAHERDVLVVGAQ